VENFQNLEGKGVIWKIFRNKELGPKSSVSSRFGLDSVASVTSTVVCQRVTMRLLQYSSSPSLETDILLGATFSKIFAWSEEDVCESDHRLIVMNQDKACELAV
jgi:hypothetical protein